MGNMNDDSALGFAVPCIYSSTLSTFSTSIKVFSTFTVVLAKAGDRVVVSVDLWII